MINEYAKEFILKGDKDVTVFVIHGFTSSPSYMKKIAMELNKKGYTVCVPLLAGHGVNDAYLFDYSFNDWEKSIEDFISKNNGQGKLFIIGHSLGGILTLDYASKNNVSGIITLSAPIKIYKYYSYKIFSMFLPKKYGDMGKFLDEEEMFRYHKASGKSVGELLSGIRKVKKQIRNITCPCFVISGNKDDTVKLSSIPYILENISSKIKKGKIINAPHQCTVSEIDQYIDDVIEFIEQNS